MRKALYAAGAALMLASSPAAAIDTVLSADANALGSALAGTGITVNSASLTSNTQNGFFSNGLSGVGINQGVVLTTGTLACVGSANTTSSCEAPGANSSLQLAFTLASDSLFFNYVFASEEYNEFVGTAFNDSFELLLNGPGFANVNLAQIPGGGGPVSINNVNLSSNSSYFIDNISGGRPIQYDGLTTVLTASAIGLTPGAAYTLSFNINDVADVRYDSAVFIAGGTVGTTPTPTGAVPEPGTWALMLLGFGAIGSAMRRRRGMRLLLN